MPINWILFTCKTAQLTTIGARLHQLAWPLLNLAAHKSSPIIIIALTPIILYYLLCLCRLYTWCQATSTCVLDPQNLQLSYYAASSCPLYWLSPLASSALSAYYWCASNKLAWPMLIIPATILFQLLIIAHLVECSLAQLALLFTIGASHLVPACMRTATSNSNCTNVISYASSCPQPPSYYTTCATCLL